MRTGPYAIYGLLLLVAAFVVFRIVVRRDYRIRGKLTIVSSVLETAVFACWAWFTYLNSPGDWPALHTGLAARVIGWPLFAGGMGLTVISMVWLGLRRSFGHDVGVLRSSGVYALTRNPQAVAFTVGVAGYLVLWPTWQGAVSILILGAILHMMVLTEEEYLLRVYGDEYSAYMRHVPRYLGLLRRMRETATGENT